MLQNSVDVNVVSRSGDGRQFHSFGAQAAKLRGPKLEVRQASTCRSPRAAERRWRRLVLTEPAKGHAEKIISCGDEMLSRPHEMPSRAHEISARSFAGSV